MATSSRPRFAVVKFNTSELASNALKAVQETFTRHSARSQDLSRIEGDTVYLDSSVYASYASHAALIKFLRGQEGALPQV